MWNVGNNLLQLHEAKSEIFLLGPPHTINNLHSDLEKPFLPMLNLLAMAELSLVILTFWWSWLCNHNLFTKAGKFPLHRKEACVFRLISKICQDRNTKQ